MHTMHDAPYTIRQGTAADAALRLSWREAMMRDLGHTDDARIAAAIAAFTPWLAEQMEQPGRFRAFIGEYAGTPAACAMVMIHDFCPGLADPTPRRGYLFNVYTSPQWRRRGYAGQLVQACLDWLREQDIYTASLHASAQGQSVYARLGFHTPGMPEMVCSRKDTGQP